MDTLKDRDMRDLKLMVKALSDELKFLKHIRAKLNSDLPAVAFPMIDENINLNALKNKTLCREIASRPMSRLMFEVGDYMRRFRWKSGLGVSIICCGVICGGYLFLCSNGAAPIITSAGVVSAQLGMQRVFDHHQDADVSHNERRRLAGVDPRAAPILGDPRPSNMYRSVTKEEVAAMSLNRMIEEGWIWEIEIKEIGQGNGKQDRYDEEDGCLYQELKVGTTFKQFVYRLGNHLVFQDVECDHQDNENSRFGCTGRHDPRTALRPIGSGFEVQLDKTFDGKDFLNDAKYKFVVRQMLKPSQ